MGWVRVLEGCVSVTRWCGLGGGVIGKTVEGRLLKGCDGSVIR